MVLKKPSIISNVSQNSYFKVWFAHDSIFDVEH